MSCRGTPSQGPYAPSAGAVEAVAARAMTEDVLSFPGEDADCCVARPQYGVVLPARQGGPAPHLLLCGHHFRTSIDGLARIHAAVYDAANRRVA